MWPRTLKTGKARPSEPSEPMVHGGPIRAIAISPGGDRFACLAVEHTGGKTTTVLAEWDIDSGRRRAMFPVPWQRYLLRWQRDDDVLVHDEGGLALWVFARDGKWLASGAADGTLGAWRIE